MRRWAGRLLAVPWRWVTSAWRWLTAPWRWLSGRVTAFRNFFTQMPDDAPLTETISETLGSGDSVLDTLSAFGDHTQVISCLRAQTSK